MTPQKRALLIAFITVALDLLGFGIIIPIQPFFAQHFGASPALVTLLSASYSLMQFLFVPFWGRLSDRIGRRPVILSSVAIGSVGYLLFGLAGSLPLLFVARMISGFGNANIAAAQAIIADTTSGPDRAKGMGLIGAAFGLGFIFGPAVGGWLANWGLAAPAIGAAILGVLNFVFAWFLLPETRPLQKPSEAAAPTRSLNPLTVLKRLQVYPNVLTLIALSFCLSGGFALMEPSISLLIERTWVPHSALTLASPEAYEAALLHAAALTSYLLVAVGLTATVVQGGAIGPLTKRFGERRLIFAGLLTIAVSAALFAVASTTGVYWLIFIPGVVLATGTGLSTPSVNGLLSRAVSPQEQGSILGAAQSAQALGRVLGPALSGLLFEWYWAAPFISTSIVMVGALGLVRVITPVVPPPALRADPSR